MNRLNWRDKYQCHVNISFPDGSNIGVWVPKDVEVNDYVSKMLENWYENTRNNSKEHDHFILKEKCPNCGGELRGKIVGGKCYVWCIDNSSCSYTRIEEKAGLERICEKHGLNYVKTHKTGACIVFSNRSINKRGE